MNFSQKLHFAIVICRWIFTMRTVCAQILFLLQYFPIFGQKFFGDALHKNMSCARKMPLKFLILDLQGCIWAQMKAYKIILLIVLSILNLVYLVEQENSAANGLKTWSVNCSHVMKSNFCYKFITFQSFCHSSSFHIWFHFYDTPNRSETTIIYVGTDQTADPVIIILIILII